MAATTSTGIHHGRLNGPTSVNMNSAASIASTATIGTSAAIIAGTLGQLLGALRRSAAILVATPTCALTTLASDPIPAARKTRRRGTVPPAATTQPFHASLRVTMKPPSLELLDDVSAKDRADIIRVALEEVLETDRFPEITFESTVLFIRPEGAAVQGKVLANGRPLGR